MNFFGEFDMLRKLWMVAVGLLLAGAAVESNGGVIATWDFESGGFSATGGQNPWRADSLGTSGSLSSGTFGWATVHAGVGTGTGNPGTSFEFSTAKNKANDMNTTVGGSGTALTFSGSYLTLTLTANSGIALNTFTLSYSAKAGQSAAFSGGAVGNTWYYSTDSGTSWHIMTSSAISFSADGAYHSESATFGGLSGGGTILLRDAISGGTANDSVNTSFIDFDNIQVSAVPEPVNMALAFFGVGFAAVAAWRKLKSGKQKAEIAG